MADVHTTFFAVIRYDIGRAYRTVGPLLWDLHHWASPQRVETSLNARESSRGTHTYGTPRDRSYR